MWLGLFGYGPEVRKVLDFLKGCKQSKNKVLCDKSIWSTKVKIFTVWPFTEKACRPFNYTNVIQNSDGAITIPR